MRTVRREIIRYLDREERAKTRSLYEECFPEDTGVFVDYYYREKIKDNQILAMEGADGVREEEGWPQVMLHLNPFAFRFGGENVSLDYIVAVATDPRARGQGKMSRVMVKALLDLAARRHPFTFLIPATPAVYRSSGFAFLPEGTKETSRSAGAGSGGGLWVEELREEDFAGAAVFANERMAEQYDVFPLWSRAYMARMRQELAAQAGGMLAVRERSGALAGLATYGREEDAGELLYVLALREDRAQVRKLIEEHMFGMNIHQIRDAEMPFMVRILDLKRLMELMGGGKTGSFRLRVRLKDEVVKENNGCFLLYCGEGASGIRQIPEEEAECEMDIAALAVFLFGKIRMYVREWV